MTPEDGEPILEPGHEPIIKQSEARFGALIWFIAAVLCALAVVSVLLQTLVIWP
jgi:hypothetical protein